MTKPTACNEIETTDYFYLILCLFLTIYGNISCWKSPQMTRLNLRGVLFCQGPKLFVCQLIEERNEKNKILRLAADLRKIDDN